MIFGLYLEQIAGAVMAAVGIVALSLHLLYKRS